MKCFFIFYFILFTRISLMAQLNTVEGKQQIITASGNQTTTTEQFTYPTLTMVRINPKKISEGLKKTLGNAGYIGWEKGVLYLDKKTNEYALHFPSSTSEEAKDKRESVRGNSVLTGWHFFTYDGKPFSVDQYQP